MKRNLFNTFSTLAFRSALYSGVLSGVLTAVLAKFYFDTTINTALLFAGLVTVSCMGIVYVVIFTLQFSRLEQLNRIQKNIAAKQFHDYEDLKTEGKDELDSMIRQSIRASKTVEREIQRLNRIENYRKEFIGDISHELKTPIFAVQGFVETLLNGAIEDDSVNRQFLKKAMRNVNRLIFLTKDLMEISKLETGELKSEIEDFRLQEVIVDVGESLQFKAKNENVSLKLQKIPSNLIVSADRNQIKQVLINLVENAIKYNYPGGSVRVGTKPYEDDKSRVLVYVKDTGIGINRQYIERVTERFFRIDKSRSREKGGTGLGLAIVKHIMEAHDERFFIESTPSVGSTFSFTLQKADRAFISA